jgi:hypothetical protein
MFGSSGNGGRRGAFQGGIWGTDNPFRGGGSVGGGGFRPVQPIRAFFDGDYDDGAHYEEGYGGGPSMYDGMGACGPPMGIGGLRDMTGPMAQPFSYSSYLDGDGNTYEEAHDPGGPFRNIVRSGQMDQDMGMGQRGMPMGGAMPSRDMADGRRTGAFQSGFWAGGNSYAVNRRGVGGRVPGPGPDPYFATELEPVDMPCDSTITQDNADTMADFIQQHTQSVAEGGANAPPNAECPICLEPSSATHLCVQIKDLPPCDHMIGRECLKQMLMHRPDDRKECPLCRTLFIKEDGVWQNPAAFEQLEPGINGGGPVGPPRGLPAQDPRNPNMSGMSNVRGMGDIDSEVRRQPPIMGRLRDDLGRELGNGLGAPGNFGGGGRHLDGPRPYSQYHMGNMHEDGRPQNPYNGGMGYGGGNGGGQRHGGAFQGGIWGGGNPFR